MLREIQEKLQSAITRFDYEALPLEGVLFIDETPPLEIDERVRIYSGGWYARLHGSFKEDFALTARELGAADFHRLVEGFLRAHPPSRFEMNGMGDGIPEFLNANFEVCDRPWLIDLARLERAWYQAGYAADTDARTFAALAGLDAEALTKVEITLGPSLSLLDVMWDVDIYWKAAFQDEEGECASDAPPKLSEPMTLAVFREGHSCRVERIDSATARALRSIGEGICLAEWLEIDGSAAFAPHLGEWASRGWLVLGSSLSEAPFQ